MEALKGLIAIFFVPGDWGEQIRRRRQQKRHYFRNEFSAFVLKLVAIISTRLKCQMLANYDLRKTSHKRCHLVVRRAVTTKKCAKQCAHVFFWRCRCRRRRRRRCSNRLYCFNLSIKAISLQSISRWRVYDRGVNLFWSMTATGTGTGTGTSRTKQQLKPLSHASG